MAFMFSFYLYLFIVFNININYIKYKHTVFSGKTGEKLNEIINTLKNKNSSKSKKNDKKCTIYDFFQIATDIDTNHTPLLVLPPSIKDVESIRNKQSHGLKVSLDNASQILKKSINGLFGSKSNNEDDQKYNKSKSKKNMIEYERPSYLDYRYPIYKLPQKFKFEAANPRIELFGKDIVPKHKLNLLESCLNGLPNKSIKKYDMYACDIYKYIGIKSHIPDWILRKQNDNKPLNDNRKVSSPKWLQNIRLGMGIKQLIKLLCSTMPCSYKNKDNGNVEMRIPNVPDIRYEVVANTYCQNNRDDSNYYHQLRMHQDIISFNILGILLGLLKLFKSHEILQFEYLRYLLQKNNGYIVLCKLFNHPFTINTNNKLFITKPESYIDYDLQQLINEIYGNDNNRDMDDYKEANNLNANPRIMTIKINCLRIIQKCVKYSYGHCRILCDVLKCHEWMVKYTTNNDDILRYYILKLYKCMIPFLNQEWRNKKTSIEIIEMIKNHVRIGVNDQWLSFDLNNKINEAINEYKRKQEEPSNLQLNDYYQWLGLKAPTEKDYAETCWNPFYITNNYGQPHLEIYAPKKWNQLMDDTCTEYHEWLFLQIKDDNKEFEKQKRFIGMTKKEMEKQKMIDRSNKVDQGLAKIKIPEDFDFSEYLTAYFNGNEDELLNKI